MSSEANQSFPVVLLHNDFGKSMFKAVINCLNKSDPCFFSCDTKQKGLKYFIMDISYARQFIFYVLLPSCLATNCRI
jgi:hypothetical protein